MNEIGKYLPSILTLIFAITLVTYCTDSKADTLSLISGSWSKHIEPSQEYNEEHSSVGIKYTTKTEPNERGYTNTSHRAFTFINSYSNRGYAYMWSRSGCRDIGKFTGCVGITAGATTGYDIFILPVAAPTIDLSYDIININLMYVPIANVLTSQLEVHLMEF